MRVVCLAILLLIPGSGLAEDLDAITYELQRQNRLIEEQNHYLSMAEGRAAERAIRSRLRVHEYPEAPAAAVQPAAKRHTTYIDIETGREIPASELADYEPAY